MSSQAVTTEGALFSFGYGRRGQLGHGDRDSCAMPERVRTLSSERVVQVSAGNRHSLALTTRGAVFRSAQLTTVSASVPHSVRIVVQLPWGSCVQAPSSHGQQCFRSLGTSCAVQRAAVCVPHILRTPPTMGAWPCASVSSVDRPRFVMSVLACRLSFAALVTGSTASSVSGGLFSGSVVVPSRLQFSPHDDADTRTRSCGGSAAGTSQEIFFLSGRSF